MEHVADALFVYDPEGRIFDVNRRACNALGYTREELLSLAMTDVETLLVPEGYVGLWRRLAPDEPVLAEGTQRRKDGSTFPVEVRVSLLETNGRRLALSLARDITERKAFTKQLSYRAFHDPLTGLPNRTLFMDRLERTLIRVDRRGNSVAILFLDLDDFKLINDSLGHDTGDQLLLEVGRRLDSGVRVSDTVARLGGDEFVVLLDDVGDEGEAALVADRIRKELEAPFELGERKVHVTASIGVAIRISQEPRGLLRDADLAMYSAKKKGKNCYEVYDPGTPTRRSG